MKHLHIAMLAPFGIRPKGTLIARMLPLAQALTQRGHTVTIIAPPVQNPQDAGTRVILDGVTVIHTPRPYLPAPGSMFQHVTALFSTTLKTQPDLIHLFKPKGYSGLAALATRHLHPKCPLVVDTDDWEGWGGWNDLLPYPYPAKALFAWQERSLPRHATTITVASRTLEQQVRNFGVAPSRIFYVPNGVTITTRIEKKQRDPQQQTLLLYTRFWEFTVRDLIIALAAIFTQFPRTRLLIIGRGERGQENELLELAQRTGIASAIDYRGWVEPAQLPVLLATADIALAPLDNTLINRARGLAKLVELMAMELAIITGDVGQAREYIEHEQSGLLTPPRDPAALAQATLRLMNDSDLRNRLAQNAHKRALQTFTWERLATTVEHAYQAALYLTTG